MINFNIKAISTYRDVSVSSGDTTIYLGILDKEEIQSLIEQLKDTIDTLERAL